MPVVDLFVQVYVLVADAVETGAVPIAARPGAEVLRQQLVATIPEDGWQQIDTTALPVKHPSRVRRADAWDGPADLRAGFGRDAAHGEWFYGFRLGLRTDWGAASSGPGRSPPQPSMRVRSPTICSARPRRSACCWIAASWGTPGRRPRPTVARASSSRTAAPSDRPCHVPFVAPSRPCAIASKPPSANSPTRSDSPVTAPRPSGGCSHLPLPPSSPTPYFAFAGFEPPSRASGVQHSPASTMLADTTPLAGGKHGTLTRAISLKRLGGPIR